MTTGSSVCDECFSRDSSADGGENNSHCHSGADAGHWQQLAFRTLEDGQLALQPLEDERLASEGWEPS